MLYLQTIELDEKAAQNEVKVIELQQELLDEERSSLKQDLIEVGSSRFTSKYHIKPANAVNVAKRKFMFVPKVCSAHLMPVSNVRRAPVKPVDLKN
jgi:hypothetical protein